MRELVPRPAVEDTARALLEDAAPLFEEEGNSLPFAEVSNFDGPLTLHGASVWSAFAADYDPGYPFYIYISDRCEERLYG